MLKLHSSRDENLVRSSRKWRHSVTKMVTVVMLTENYTAMVVVDFVKSTEFFCVTFDFFFLKMYFFILERASAQVSGEETEGEGKNLK